VSYIPGTLAAILRAFEDCFTRPSHLNFVTLVSAWLVCTGRHTIARVVAASASLGRARHHARYHRFFAASAWRGGTEAVGRVLFGLLLPHLPACIEAAVDDTLCHRRGPQLFGAGMHHDTAASSYGRGGRGRTCVFSFGHNWVVLAVRVPLPWAPGRGIAVPGPTMSSAFPAREVFAVTYRNLRALAPPGA
jgi:hypothetical protein